MVILEVGTGGRTDATNIVDADVAVVTSIALDHTDWLGPDRESIGREKAGIFRAGKAAIVGEPDMPLTMAQVADEKGARLLRRDVDWRYEAGEQGWSFYDRQGALTDLPLPQVPMPNAATAIAALRASGLKVSEQAIRDGVQRAMLPGRFQIISEAPGRSLMLPITRMRRHISRGVSEPYRKRGACWRLLVCCMTRISQVRWQICRRKLTTGTARRWKGRVEPRRSSCWNICAQAKSILASRRRGMPRWRTPDLKIRCWYVVHSTRWRM